MSDWEEDPVPSQPQQDFSRSTFGNDSSESFGFGNMKITDDYNNNFADNRNGFGDFESFGGGRGGRGRGKGRARGRGRGNACFKCQEEGHRASDCPSNDSEGGNSFVSSFGDDNKRDGFGDRPKGRGCFKCHQDGHRAADCPNGEGNGGFGSFGDGKRGGGFGGSSQSRRGCFKCHEDGHRAADCPNEESSVGFGSFGNGKNDDGFGSNKKGCFKCGEEGHISRDCTQSGGGRPRVSNGYEDNGEAKPRNPLYIPVELEDDQLLSQGIEAGINFDKYGNIPIQVSGDGSIPEAVDDFSEMNLRKLLLENLDRAKFQKPTPIQSVAVPVLMAGRDIMGCAQTGSGKTIAYLLPMLNYILKESCDSHSFEDAAKPTGLIICPTRELAIQIYGEARKLGIGSTVLNRMVYGGTAVYHQLKQIQSGCHVLVGTVGRIVDFMGKGKLCFDELKFLVLDEADRMLSMGFLPDLKKILEHSSMPPCNQRQTLMFSATFPAEIQTLASSFMNNYVFVSVGTVGAANTDVTQEIIEVEKVKKKDLLIEYITEMQRVEENVKILVFVEQKKMADFVGSYLCNNDIMATTIHGDRFQKQREEALLTFRNGTFNVLVATAVAARGLDIRGVGCVINFDLPKEVDEYVHRIGRTGRVGNTGYALSFYDNGADAPIAKDLLKILAEADQEVPEWLKEAADNSGSIQGYFGSGKYASTDVRRDSNIRGEGRNWEGKALGGPSFTPADEDDWDL